MRSNKSQRGFTLIEVLIVVIIIGILSALAIPRFMANTRRGKQTEAQLVLKQIYVMQRAHFGEHNTYGANGLTADVDNPNGLSAIGVQLSGVSRYAFSVEVTNGGASFTATAAGNIDDDVILDTWEITEDGIPENVVDDNIS